MKLLSLLFKVSCFVYLIFCTNYSINAQIVATPCEGVEIDITNLTPAGMVDHSSTFSFSPSNIADVSRSNDGITSGDETNISQTIAQTNPWWEADLGDSYMLRGLQIWYPESHYPSGLSNYYILVSHYPFSSTDLTTELSSPYVEHVYVQTSLSTGSEIPLEYRQAQYVRIQLDGFGDLALFEIGIPGGGEDEICDNGIDDDCDGDIDCADLDCGVKLFNIDNSNAPSCIECSDGMISIQANGENLLYSIDGGTAFQESYTFDNLLPGEYSIVVVNSETQCSALGITTLTASAGTPSTCCENGGYELGTFSNWTGGVGEISLEGEILINNEDFATTGSNPQHLIILKNGNYQDPIVPNLPVFNTASGDFLARLGNELGNQAEKLSYSMTVAECNTNLMFNYLMVGDEANDLTDHGVDGNGFFQYRISSGNDEIELVKIHIDENGTSPFFNILDPNETPPDVFTNWECVSIDLSDYIGEEVLVEFITGDCILNEHHCYTYIDGLCDGPPELIPVVDLQLNDVFCNNQIPLIDASGSLGYSQFGWDVCELNGAGEEINCVIHTDLSHGILDLFDVKAYYEDGGQMLECGKRYRVTLTLANDCVDPVSAFVEFDLLCSDIPELVYKDIITCGNTGQDITIEGELTCPSCTFEWTPGIIYLDDASIPFPTIEGSTNANAFNTNYSVIATNSEGCVEVAEVNITKLQEFNIEFDYVAEDYCNTQIYANINAIGPEVPNNVISEVTFTNLTLGETYPGELIFDNESNFWRYVAAGVYIPKNIGTTEDWQVEAFLNTELYTFADDCVLVASLDEIPPDNLYYGNVFFVMPDAFTPNGDGINDLFRPVAYEEWPGINAYYGKLEVWNRWGQKIWKKEAWGDVNVNMSFDPTEISWDGTCNIGSCSGEPVVSEVYVFILTLKNCDNLEGEQINCPKQCNGLEDPSPPDYLPTCDEDNDCTNNACVDCLWAGDVTLIL